ncbi:hypothetical protein GCM10007858_38330 [Bradyrhizobium liaoningense]|nr:hypothetical protein GCM10007858_38330 [Bradyrhizobium liaoningense]
MKAVVVGPARIANDVLFARKMWLFPVLFVTVSVIVSPRTNPAPGVATPWGVTLIASQPGEAIAGSRQPNAAHSDASATNAFRTIRIPVPRSVAPEARQTCRKSDPAA